MLRRGRDRRDLRARPQRDARHLRPDARRTFDADGFYPTGDLGALDADGYLWYHGRRDDMFKVKGATVYPSEVEAALRAIDGVRQAHVTNVPRRRRRDAVGALVVSSAAARRARRRGPRAAERVQGADALGRDRLGRRRADDPTAKVDKAALQELLDDGEGTAR